MMMVVKVAGVMNPPSLTVEGNRRNSHRKSFRYCHSFFFFLRVNAGFITLVSFYLLFVVASFSHFFFLDKIM
jgi:hypothetical protein